MTLSVHPLAYAGTNSDANSEQGSSDSQGTMSMVTGTLMNVAGGVMLGVGIYQVATGTSTNPFGIPLITSGNMLILGGVVLLGMGAMSIAQALADDEAAGQAGDVADYTSNIPKFDSFGRPIPKGDETVGGSSIFSGPGGAKLKQEYKDSLALLKKNGVSYNPKTGIVTTPHGNFNGANLNGDLESLKALGLNDKVAKLVKGKVDAASLAGQAQAKKIMARKNKGKNKKKKVAKNSGQELNFGGGTDGAASDSGGLAGRYPNGLKRNMFKKLKGRSKIKGQVKAKKPRMYYGTPVGHRTSNLFELVTATYVKKRQVNFFIPHP